VETAAFVFSFWDFISAIILLMGMAALCPLFGVVLGGLFVLRAKGNGYEPILPPLRQEQEEALNLDDLMEGLGGVNPMENIDSKLEDIFAQRAAEDPNLRAARGKGKPFVPASRPRGGADDAAMKAKIDSILSTDGES
jgi:hypothetical protein